MSEEIPLHTDAPFNPSDRGGRGRAHLGDSHPETMSSMYSLADLLKTMGQLEEAEQLFREELEKCGPACTAR